MRSVEMKNRCLLYYGNPVGYRTEQGVVADSMFRREELEDWLARKGLAVRWEDGIYDRLSSGGYQKAADNGDGIEQQDVDVLKLLYLIRYVDDIPANLDNIVILMADDIRTDKIELRQTVQKSLDRLKSQNYIDRRGDAYIFLTDEEQDIQREIKTTNVDTAAIVGRIAQMIFADIYTTKKYRYGKYDFAFDQMVDGITVGAVTGGMRLKFLTVATDTAEKSDLQLMTDSKGQAIVSLPDAPYFESLENAMKIRKYVKQRNVSQLPKSVQDIIRDQQDEATQYESAAMENLRRPIDKLEMIVDKEAWPMPSYGDLIFEV